MASNLSQKLAIPLVIVVGGVGVYLAVPPLMCGCSTKDKAYVAAMKSDLRNLVYAEEYYRDSTRSYSADQRALNYNTSMGVTIEITLGDSGWSAIASHSALRSGRCAVFVGTVPRPLEQTVAVGEPRCERVELK